MSDDGKIIDINDAREERECEDMEIEYTPALACPYCGEEAGVLPFIDGTFMCLNSDCLEEFNIDWIAEED